MAVSKVIYGNTTVIDITDSTVNANNLLSGNKAYGADGEPVFGVLSVGSTINVTTSDVELFGETLTLSKDSTTLTTTFDNSGEATFTSVLLTGTLTLTCGEYINTISVPSYDTYNVEFITVPNGKLVTPTDDIQIWLACADIKDKSYTTLAEVLADRETFETLIADSNACDYMARSTTWAGSSAGLVPTMTSNTTPSGVVTDSSDYNLYYGWEAFSATTARGWFPANTNLPNANLSCYVQYEFTEAKVANKIYMKHIHSSAVSVNQVFKLLGSNTGDANDFTEIASNLTIANTNTDYTHSFSNGTAYKYYRICFISTTGTYNTGTGLKFQLYCTGITTNADAMALIGKYEYCSNALLGNVTWAEAIANSDYFEEVLNVKVPVMTGATTPSGEASASNTYSTGYPWKAFNGTNVGDFDGWIANFSSGYFPAWICYKFDNPVCVKKVYFENRNYSGDDNVRIKTYKVQASNDNFVSDIHDLTDLITRDNSKNVPKGSDTLILDDNVDAYTSYRLYITERFAGQGSHVGCAILQFYGRAEKIIYSPKVPTMTSDTQPSGEAVGSTADSGLQLYRMFNKNSMDCYSTAPNTPTTGFYAGYKFDTATVINKLSIMTTFWHTNSSSAYYDLGIYGGDSLNNLTKLSTTNLRFTSTTSLTAQTTQELTFDNDTAYLYYVLKFESASSGISYMKLQSTYAFMIWELQFYSKASATNLVHSCGNDTLYYYDSNDTAVTLCTTDENGDGIIDYGSLDAGYYTIYSTVAKDPSNLSNAYSKTVRITNTPYGHTTEAYIMPDGALYWYGFFSNNCGIVSSDNGWTFSSNAGTWRAPVYNTNSVTIHGAYNQTTGKYEHCGISSLNKIDFSQYTTCKISCKNIENKNPAWFSYGQKTNKNMPSVYGEWGNQVPQTTDALLSFNGSGEKYVGISTSYYDGGATIDFMVVE